LCACIARRSSARALGTGDASARDRVPHHEHHRNFGEVANGARFVQASQLSLNGSGIGTFSDRARDYVRGGGPFDGGLSLVRNQGYVNGLFYDDNGSGAGKSRNDLMWAADIIKVGLAGSIRDYVLTTHWDASLRLDQLDYNGQPAGYVTDPQEVVNYVENHDNQTLFDINAYKLPVGISREDGARAQLLGAAINAFSQGVTYFHAGVVSSACATASSTPAPTYRKRSAASGGTLEATCRSSAPSAPVTAAPRLATICPVAE
jgi:hypothetical protein